MLSALHSVLIDVRDFEAAVGDYSRLLGAAPHHLESSPERGTRSAIFRLANTSLELRARREGSASVAGIGDETGAGRFGQSGLRFSCDDENPVPMLQARGVPLAAIREEEARVEGAPGPRRWRSHLVEPAASRGLPVELVRDETRAPIAPSTASTANVPRPTPCDPKARIRALDHVVVLSPDVEATRAFYADGLGLRLALDRSFEQRGVRLLFFRVGGTTIEIGSRLGVAARPDRPDRFGGLAWQVVDVDAIRARLVAEGFDVSEIREGHKPGTRVCTVREPVHGVPTLLIEPVA
jgi:catechol 2,3-dioxygenase-like lactoylglutathione lyase family enzyme